MDSNDDVLAEIDVTATAATTSGVVHRAIGALQAQRGYDLPQAVQLLEQVAETRDRSTVDIARELLAQTERGTDASPVHLALSYTKLGDAINAAPADLAPLRATEAAVDQIPGADWASITVSSQGRLATVASTHPAARTADQLQYQLGEGPCIDAALDTISSAFLAPNLDAEGRWPRFAAAAGQQLGVQAMLSMRLGLDIDDLDDTVASLNIYATTVDPFDDHAIAMCTLLAAHASTAVIASQYQHRVTHLQEALNTNREIGMAMGILMHQHKVTSDRAFALLRIASQHTNRKLRDIASEVVTVGLLNLP